MLDNPTMRTLIPLVTGGVVIFNEKGKVIVVNPYVSFLLGITNLEVVGHDVDTAIKLYRGTKLVPKEERPGYTVIKLKKTRWFPKDDVLYIRTKSGKKFPVFIVARPLELEGEKGGIIIMRDITVEKELANYQVRTRQRLSELLPILQKTAVGDFSGHIKLPKKEDEFSEINAAIKIMREDLRQLEYDRAQAEKEKLQAIRDAEKKEREYIEKYSKDLEVEVEKKTQELSDTKIHIESIIENLTAGIIEYGPDFTVKRINRTAAEILRLDRNKVLGRKIVPRDIEDEDLHVLASISYPILLGKRGMKLNFDDRYSLIWSDMEEVTLEHPVERVLQVVTAPVLSLSREPGGFVKVVRDITREKIISRNKSEFISIAAHQLRTPLAAVRWAIYMTLNGKEELSMNTRRYLEGAFTANDKLITLVNDLLNIAKIESGRFGYEFKEHDFLKVIDHVVEGVKDVARRKDITLTYTKPNAETLMAVFDDAKVSMVAHNLLDNSIKYTPKGGNITVDLSTEGDYITMTVSDTGIGIPKHQLDRVFTRFFRAENAMRKQIPGTGFGLFISRNIVVRHGGDMKVSSSEGKGTTFSITLPLKESMIPTDVGIVAIEE